jgi:hypothetical protein
MSYISTGYVKGEGKVVPGLNYVIKAYGGVDV